MADAALQLPSALARQTRYVRLAGVPALLAHPDWAAPAPTLIWLHGRTVQKELDNGRYLRLIRAGIAVCALDLPGHGERLDPAMHQPTRTLDVVAQAVGEIDGVVGALGDPPLGGCFDPARLALGGMSAGGMVTLRRLCDPHPFVAAAVEGTAGDLAGLYLGPDRDEGGHQAGEPGRVRLPRHAPERVAALDALPRVGSWRPIPLLALHSEADRLVPVGCIRGFIDALRVEYARRGADGGMVRLHTWPQTGAPEEHNGFGRVAGEAKALQVEFLRGVFGLPTGGGA
jgi:alpha-beta hydrolase superfamily lysophospholipase